MIISIRWVARVLAVMLVTFTATEASTVSALGAGGWPLAGPAEVLLAYGAGYPGEGGSTRVHSGLDLVAEAGADVLACTDGRVVFAGRVPADGGGSCWAVSIEDASGLRFTFLPIDEVDVRSGEPIRAGDRVGSLAGAGDASSSLAHLHLSVRRGGAYLDPSAFITPPALGGGDAAGSATGNSLPEIGADEPCPTASRPAEIGVVSGALAGTVRPPARAGGGRIVESTSRSPQTSARVTRALAEGGPATPEVLVPVANAAPRSASGGSRTSRVEGVSSNGLQPDGPDRLALSPHANSRAADRSTVVPTGAHAPVRRSRADVIVAAAMAAAGFALPLAGRRATLSPLANLAPEKRRA